MSVVAPSCAVTTVVIVLEPTFNAIGVEVVPEATSVPFIRTVAPALLVVGLTVILVVELGTISV